MSRLWKLNIQKMSEKELQRERLASFALQGLLASAPVEAILNPKGYAQAAVKLADSLIRELKKPLEKEKPVKTGL